MFGVNEEGARTVKPREFGNLGARSDGRFFMVVKAGGVFRKTLSNLPFSGENLEFAARSVKGSAYTKPRWYIQVLVLIFR